MQDMTHRHEDDNLMKDIPIYDGKNMELADWLLQIKKVASLTHSQEYILATAKSNSTPYKILNIKRKLEELYSPIATELHVAIDLHCKQRPDETLQKYIQKFD